MFAGFLTNPQGYSPEVKIFLTKQIYSIHNSINEKNIIKILNL